VLSAAALGRLDNESPDFPPKKTDRLSAPTQMPTNVSKAVKQFER